MSIESELECRHGFLFDEIDYFDCHVIILFRLLKRYYLFEFILCV